FASVDEEVAQTDQYHQHSANWQRRVKPDHADAEGDGLLANDLLEIDSASIDEAHQEEENYDIGQAIHKRRQTPRQCIWQQTNANVTIFLHQQHSAQHGH